MTSEEPPIVGKALLLPSVGQGIADSVGCFDTPGIYTLYVVYCLIEGTTGCATSVRLVT